MNRFAAAGLLMEVFEGRHLVVLSPSRREAHAAFEIAAAVSASMLGSLSIVRTSGNERIQYGPGSVIFRTPDGSLRGYAPDVVYCDGGVHLDGDLRDHLHNGGEVVVA